MRIIDCVQGSEQWESYRHRPTASQFHRICTPVKGQYAASAKDYACELIAKQLGVYTEPPPSYWMEWGTENEPNAIQSYQRRHKVKINRPGFVFPDDTDAFGGSPDSIVDDEGLLEVKCPKPETLIKYHSDGVLPPEYKPQIQGLLLITELEWCDFYVWHPELQPFELRVQPDVEYQTNILDCLELFLAEFMELRLKVNKLDLPEPYSEPGQLVLS